MKLEFGNSWGNEAKIYESSSLDDTATVTGTTVKRKIDQYVVLLYVYTTKCNDQNYKDYD
ncbi:hypothetical protein F938_03141 [Acinetobacter bereziniae LMG 1003 = CIP 70.12]|uniref:Uncharacterized protein n=1 Tax=Acinetobacter bereziniae LMG 1003 = CIP 70.12 TaxID=981324 RepID=N9EAQ2_ACIBZ|nr:hypothetical protein F938_03141 [Acinetobacter bereziniae LMG 1003 = CIP 70.12]